MELCPASYQAPVADSTTSTTRPVHDDARGGRGLVVEAMSLQRQHQALLRWRSIAGSWRRSSSRRPDTTHDDWCLGPPVRRRSPGLANITAPIKNRLGAAHKEIESLVDQRGGASLDAGPESL